MFGPEDLQLPSKVTVIIAVTSTVDASCLFDPVARHVALQCTPLNALCYPHLGIKLVANMGFSKA